MTAKGKRRNLSYTALSAVLLMFGAISLLLSGIAAKVDAFGTAIKLSIPVFSASPLVDMLTTSGMIKFLFVAYIVLTVIAVILFAAAVFMIITRRQTGILAGFIANIIAAVLGIIVIIAVFVVNGKHGSTAFSVMPSMWLWASVPINIVSLIFLFLEKDEIV